jgi:hypothetical protein
LASLLYLLLTYPFRKPRRAVLLTLGLALLATLALFGWYYRYRFYFMNSGGPSEGTGPLPVAAYTERPLYAPGETLRLAYYASDSCRLRIERMSAPYRYRPVLSQALPPHRPASRRRDARRGCGWPYTYRWKLPDSLPGGYYRFRLLHPEDTFASAFLLQAREAAQAPVAMLAPVSTWLAYNRWGGRSLYYNGDTAATNYHVAWERPLTSLHFDSVVNPADGGNIHDLQIEANIYRWLAQQARVAVYPDFALETMPPGLAQAELIVLAFKNEYVSRAMYNRLEALVARGRSLLALGANQVYWRAEWDSAHRILTCRKDLTGHRGHFWDYGGMWRHHLRHESGLLGAGWDRHGINTYAPYRLEAPEHPLTKGLQLKRGALFGKRGINQLPLSGPETDKTSFSTPGDAVVLARGLNPDGWANLGYVWPQALREGAWDGSGGADMTYYQTPSGGKVLSTASMQSGAGLGVDPVLTHIVAAFLRQSLVSTER